MPMHPRKPPLSPPPPPLLAVPLFATQIEAVLEAAGGSDPRSWSGYRRLSLARSLARLRAALAGAAPVGLGDAAEAVDRLAGLIAGARVPAFRALASGRVRALTAVALVWRACEELPEGPTRDRLLDVESVDGTEWMADALEATAVAGLRVTLPGEGDEPEDEDDGPDTQLTV